MDKRVVKEIFIFRKEYKIKKAIQILINQNIWKAFHWSNY